MEPGQLVPDQKLVEVQGLVVELHGAMDLVVELAIAVQRSSRRKGGRLPPHLTTAVGLPLKRHPYRETLCAIVCEPCYKECEMIVAEYCGNCDRKTMRQTEPCQICTPKNVDSQKSDVQQLKAEIAALANELELIPGTGFMVGKRVDVLAKMRQLSAI